jgi:hypothetical protein
VESSFFLSFYVFVSVVHLSLFSIHVQLHAKLSAAIDIEISFKQDLHCRLSKGSSLYKCTCCAVHVLF